MLEFNTQKVKGVMAEHSFSQSALSEKLGITENSVRNKLNGRTQFTAEEISAICNTFQVNADIFFTPK